MKCSPRLLLPCIQQKVAKGDEKLAYLNAIRKLSEVSTQNSFTDSTLTKPPRSTTVDHNSAKTPGALAMFPVAVRRVT